jgi:hypothetical protein
LTARSRSICITTIGRLPVVVMTEATAGTAVTAAVVAAAVGLAAVGLAAVGLVAVAVAAAGAAGPAAPEVAAAVMVQTVGVGGAQIPASIRTHVTVHPRSCACGMTSGTKATDGFAHHDEVLPWSQFRSLRHWSQLSHQLRHGFTTTKSMTALITKSILRQVLRVIRRAMPLLKWVLIRLVSLRAMPLLVLNLSLVGRM